MSLRPHTPSSPPSRLLRLPVVVGSLLGALLVGAYSGCAPRERPVAERPAQLLEPGSFAAVWTQNIDTGRYGRPSRLFLRDEMVLLYTNRRAVYAISSVGGTTQWVSNDVVGRRDVLWPPVLLEALGRLEGVERIIAFPSNTSYIIFSDDGTRIQETPIERGTRALTSPSYGYEGLAYAGLSDDYGGRAAAIDPTRLVNPVVLPRLLRGVIIGRPVVYADTFFIGDETGSIYAITERGDQAWPIPRFDTGGPVTANLAADEDGLYVPSNDSVLYVLDRATGRLRWRYFAQVPLFRSAFPTRDHVFLPVEGRGVAALSKHEGAAVNREPVWVAPNARDILSHDEQNVYLLHTDGYIVAHRKRDGEELFRTQRRDFVAFARNPAGPRIFAATARGEVVAIEPVLTRGQVGRLVMSESTGAPDRG